MFAEAVAKRVGRDAGDFEVMIFVGAFLGGMISAFVAAAGDPDDGLLEKLDQALDYMEDRLLLDPGRR